METTDVTQGKRLWLIWAPYAPTLSLCLVPIV